jgi:hypothetical protein
MSTNPIKALIKLLVSCICFSCFAFPSPILSEEKERLQISQSSDVDANKNNNNDSSNVSVDKSQTSGISQTNNGNSNQPNALQNTGLGLDYKSRYEALTSKKRINLLVDGQWKYEKKNTGEVTIYSFEKDQKSDTVGRLRRVYTLTGKTFKSTSEQTWKFQLLESQLSGKPVYKIRMTLDGDNEGINTVSTYYEFFQDGNELCMISNVQGQSYPIKFDKDDCETFVKIKEPKKAS